MLTDLNLANNGIDEIGCVALMAAYLRENGTLKNLNLDGNPLGEEVGRVLF